MPCIETADHTRLYYREWGTGSPVVFLSSWSVSGDMWQYQMLPLSNHGLRCIAYDRRGHGRSDDPGRGYDFDTLADDLAALITQLDLREVTLVGHSMGCGEIARYLTRHGTSRVARVVLVSTTTPCVLRSETNPDGAPRVALEQSVAALQRDRPAYVADGLISFLGLGSTWPSPPTVSPEMGQWLCRLSLESSLKAVIGCLCALWETDFRPDLRVFTLPTLVIHGDIDRGNPLEQFGSRTAEAIPGSILKVYEGGPHGLFITHKERLTTDLLDFIRG
ncbi:MAG TPA: alpha/beta hydrolase [Roseiflexaceae bacterium]|nr:alpha/beta hydrolase [Roseiflexaceae bacterium]